MCFLLGGLSYKSIAQAAHLASIKAVVTLRNPVELWVNRSFALSMLQFTLMHKNTHSLGAVFVRVRFWWISKESNAHLFFLLPVWSVPPWTLEANDQYELY